MFFCVFLKTVELTSICITFFK